MKARVYIRTGPGDTRTEVVEEGERVELAKGEVITKTVAIEDPADVREAIVAEQVRDDLPTTADIGTFVLTDFGLVEPLVADALAKLTPDEAAAIWRWGRGAWRRA